MAPIKGVSNLRAAMRLFVVAIAVASASAQAVVNSFSDYATFQSAAQSLATFNFNNFAPDAGTSQSYFGNPVSPAGSEVAFTALESIVSDPLIYGGGYPPTVIYTGKSADPQATLNTITATMTGMTAIGFYYGSSNFFSSPLSVKVTSNGTDTTFGALTLPSSVTLPE